MFAQEEEDEKLGVEDAIESESVEESLELCSTMRLDGKESIVLQSIGLMVLLCSKCRCVRVVPRMPFVMKDVGDSVDESASTPPGTVRSIPNLKLPRFHWLRLSYVCRLEADSKTPNNASVLSNHDFE